jgi:hypothetical protein
MILSARTALKYSVCQALQWDSPKKVTYSVKELIELACITFQLKVIGCF